MDARAVDNLRDVNRQLILDRLEQEQFRRVTLEFSISVPFARYAELKSTTESRKRWKSLDQTIIYFEERWKPKMWTNKYRFVFVREVTKKTYSLN
jgi:hypothetical protein